MLWHRALVRLAAPLLALGMLTTACGDDEQEQPATTVGIANPASVFCEEQGGTVDIVDEDGGQVGYCVLPDGSRIEEWEYFRQSGESSGDAGLANPALAPAMMALNTSAIYLGQAIGAAGGGAIVAARGSYDWLHWAGAAWMLLALALSAWVARRLAPVRHDP